MKLSLHIVGVLMLAASFGSLVGVVIFQRQLIHIVQKREQMCVNTQLELVGLYAKQTNSVAKCIEQLSFVRDRLGVASAEIGQTPLEAKQ